MLVLSNPAPPGWAANTGSSSIGNGPDALSQQQQLRLGSAPMEVGGVRLCVLIACKCTLCRALHD